MLNLPERITGTRLPCNEDAMVSAFVMPAVWMESLNYLPDRQIQRRNDPRLYRESVIFSMRKKIQKRHLF